MKSISILSLTVFIVTITLLSKQINTQDDQQQEQFAEFAQNLANFFPSQAFQLQLNTTQQQTLMFWPHPDTQFIRGLFYITSNENGGLFVGCETAGQLKKTFYNKRIGVFKLPYDRSGDMKIILKSQIHQVTVYISYQFVLKKNIQKKPNPKSLNETSQQESQLAQVKQKFEKVQKSIFGQQAILEGIVHSEMADESKIKDEVNSKAIKVVIQTVVVIISGFLSLYLLQKQLKNGYQIVI